MGGRKSTRNCSVGNTETPRLTEAVDTPANSDGDTVIVKKDTSLPWLKCEFDGRDSVCSLCACSAITLGDGFWFSEKRNTNKHTHTQTICTVIYNAQSTILMHTHTDTHTRLESPSCLPLFTYHLQAIPLHLGSEEDGPSHSVSKAERNVM